MGLNINTLSSGGSKIGDYERLGSYGTLHILRRWLMEHEEGNSEETVKKAYSYPEKEVDVKIEKYPALINHSDCDGGYLSFTHFGITETKDPIGWADLDRLRKELKEIGKLKMPDVVREVYDRLNEIVNPKDDAPVIIFFT